MTRQSPGTARPRRGRPRADQTGEVRRRILDAAAGLFLEQGYGRTTMDQVVEASRVSKTSLYARFASKQQLFGAVVRRDAEIFAESTAGIHGDGSELDRLVFAGRRLAELTLTGPSIALMRVTAAESGTLPDLAREGFRIGFGECVRCIALALAVDETQEAVERSLPRARRFVELALHPLYMHAFFGADLAGLRRRAHREIPAVAEAVLAGSLVP